MKGPLLTIEMERQMGLEDGFTYLPGVTERARHHQIGNAFHASVMEHIMQSWASYPRVERRLHLQLGFPVVSKRKALWGYRGQRVGDADHPGPPKEKSSCRVDRWTRAI